MTLHLLPNPEPHEKPREREPWIVDGELRDVPEGEWEKLTQAERLDFYLAMHELNESKRRAKLAPGIADMLGPIR